MQIFKCILSAFLICCSCMVLTAQKRAYYQEPIWKPRAFLPYEDAIRGDFWPKSPAVSNSFSDPGFALDRLSEVPAPGIHPRVLLTPKDVDLIREKVALGDKAPLPFRILWTRVARTQSAFYALVTRNDKLGKELAINLVEKIKALEPKLAQMDKMPDSENIWDVERSIVATGEPDPPTEIWDLLDYDYLSGWMSVSERELARRVIARITARRISNFLSVPDHFMINNHQGFGMEYIRLMLLIEGEKGINKELFDLSCKKANAMLDWYLDDDGMCYESIKGWLNVSAFTAVGLRQRNLLKHEHLQAKMNFFRAALRWEDGSWKIRDEMRASAFHVVWMMHYYHPNDKSIDFLYRASLSTHNFLTDTEAKWPNPVGITNELLLLYADDGMMGKDGKPLDWNFQPLIDDLKLPITWQDNQRGYVETRNSWKKEDLHLGFVCKQDFFYGGHEGSENNRITLWKDGVNWIQDNNMLATKATFLQNMLTVDGKGCHWPPAPGTWLGVKESPDGLIAAGDGKNGYSYSKSMQVHPLYFPSVKIPYLAPFSEGNFDLSRDIQVAFHPGTIKFNDGYAHTDYGPWSGETRLVEGYRLWNPMQQFYRTIQLARGENPYVLVIDDAKKDDMEHLFDWNISVPLNVELVEALTPEIQFQNTDPSELRTDDLILGKAGMERDLTTGKIKPKKGDPLCLIRVLWRNSEYGFPVPRFERYQGYNQVVVPSRSVSPEFRVLIYPYKFGDPIPKTTWNKERTMLTVQIKDKTDVYQFGQTEGGRTVLSMERKGKQVLNSDDKPARPVLLVRGSRFESSDLRDTRDEGNPPVYLVDGLEDIQLERVSAPAQIRYTLDGSEPGLNSLLYDRPIVINNSCDLKAIVYQPEWAFGTNKSDVLTAHFIQQAAAIGMSDVPTGSQPGILTRVYEKNTKLYNDKGFFDASKVMMPDLSKETALITTVVRNFLFPQAISKQPLEQQCKGFYRFTGYFLAREKGVYKFDLNSCGPVIFDIGSQLVIERTGVFHQQQAHRQGEAILDKGWHAFDLTVCDPLFWNINSLEAMPLELKYAVNDNNFKDIADSDLRYVTDSKMALAPEPQMKWLEALQNMPTLEPGFDLHFYDQTGKRRANDFLDIDGLKPYRSEKVNGLESSESRNTVRCYSGYFKAPMSGIYTFQSVGRVGESAGLGAKQASCQNQIRIGNEIVVQRGVYGRNPSGQIGLKEGWHSVSLRFGPSETMCKVLLPDGQTIQLDGNNIFRNREAEQKPATGSDPDSGSLGEVKFDKWDGKTAYFPVEAKYQIWINPSGKLVKTPFGKALDMQPGPPRTTEVDVNVSRGTIKPGIKLHHLTMCDNALSVALWFRTSEKTGKLFGKEGYNAFGKGYKTISCSVENGRLVANPGRLTGGNLLPDQWQFVVVTATESQMCIYLNGEKVASGPGTKEITTDALDFFLGHNAIIEKLHLFNRPLDEKEVKNLFSEDK